MISKDKFDEVLNNYKNLKSLLEKNCDLEVNYADYEFKNMKDSIVPYKNDLEMA